MPPAACGRHRATRPSTRRALAERGALKATAALVGLAGLVVPVVSDPVLATDSPLPRPASEAVSLVRSNAIPAGTFSGGTRRALADLTAATAVRAPEVKSPAAPSFGILGFTAVATPKQPSAANPLVARTSNPGVASRSTPRISGVGTAGLTANARIVLASITWAFPQITNVIGVRPDSLPDHPSGHAIDFMIPSPFSSSGMALGNEVVSAIQANASAWHVRYLIYRQRIWFPGSGWRAMSDRGSPTANHMDHVHVTVN
ncbi:MAG: hypothetical protein ABI131_00540 [Nostocoides sp.]